MRLRGRPTLFPRLAFVAAAAAVVTLAACSLTTSLDGYAGPPLVDASDVAVTNADAGADVTPPAPDAGADASSPAEAYRAAVLSDAPLAYYRFEGTGDVAEDERGANPGAFVGGAPRVAGLFDGEAAAYFGGSTYVRLTSAFGFPGRATFTIEAWALPVAPSGTAGCLVARSVQGMDGNVSDGWTAYLGGSNEATAARFRGGIAKMSTGAPIGTGSWSHVVVTYDALRLRVFVDGTLVADELSDTDLAFPDATATIGAGRSGIACFYRGAIDEVAIYDRVLGGDRIAAHHEAGVRRP
ncbi:MAG: Autotransporter adhesin [Labilithrix sp.]|nr:Autotransporter adhesin [Labilithrix sp.]